MVLTMAVQLCPCLNITIFNQSIRPSKINTVDIPQMLVSRGGGFVTSKRGHCWVIKLFGLDVDVKSSEFSCCSKGLLTKSIIGPLHSYSLGFYFFLLCSFHAVLPLSWVGLLDSPSGLTFSLLPHAWLIPLPVALRLLWTASVAPSVAFDCVLLHSYYSNVGAWGLLLISLFLLVCPL